MKKSENKKNRSASRSKKNSRRSKVNQALGITAVVVVAALVLGGFIAVRTAGRNISESDTILPGVTVGGISLGDMTEAEAAKALVEQGWDEIVGGTLRVDLPQDIHFSLDYYEAGASMTAAEAAHAAYRYGHEGSDTENLMAYLRSLGGPKEISANTADLNGDYIREQIAIAAQRFDKATEDKGYRLDEENLRIVFVKGAGQMKIDEGALYAMVEQALLSHEASLSYELPKMDYRMPDFAALREQTAVETMDAYYDPETDTIVPETKGVDFSLTEAERLWTAAEPGGEVAIPMTLDVPEVTAEALEELLFRDRLGEQSTNYWGSTEQRITNIDLVAQKLDGLVLMPGDEFSYNGHVGERTAEAGFQAAQAYADGQVVYEIGGGVCQVSSTLYNSVLKANLEISYRECHYFPVNYLPKGLDATVSWPRPDFRFVNDREYPIRLKAWVDRSAQSLSIEIWGTNTDGTYVEPVSSWWPLYDEEYPSVQIGWNAASWRDIYNADGELLDHVFEASSLYYLHDEDIQWPPEKFEPDTPNTPDPDVTVEDPTPPETPPETVETPADPSEEETIISG